MKYLMSLVVLSLVACGGSNSSDPVKQTDIAQNSTNTPSASPTPQPTTSPALIAHPCLIEDSVWVNLEGGCHSTIKSFTVSGTSSALTTGNAIKYCQDLVESSFSDWRLPKYSELQDLLLLNQGNFNTNGSTVFMAIDFLNVEGVVNWDGTSVSSRSHVGQAIAICIR